MKTDSVVNLPGADYLEIDNLRRVGWDLIYHPNPELVSKMKTIDGQVYLLKDTIYGVFVVEREGGLEFVWFGHHPAPNSGHEGKLIPDSALDLIEIIERCDPEKVDSLLYHLDTLAKTKKT